MRLLFITHTLPHDEAGGSQTYVESLATTLSADHEICILSGSRSGPTGLPVRTVRRLPTLEEQAPGVVKAWWHLRDQWSLRQHHLVRQEVERFAPDVVHTHQCQGLTAGVFSAIAATEVAHVHTAHDLNLICMNTQMNPRGRECAGRCAPCLVQRSVRGSLLIRRLDFLVTPSDRVGHLHVAAGVATGSQTVTIRQGAIPGRAVERGTDERPLRAGFIGALTQQKGVLTLLGALSASRGQWSLDVVGDGPLAPQVESALRTSNRLAYRGDLRGSAKATFYDAIDVLIVPSEGEENAPLVIAEASVRGIPSVVSHVGGLSETAMATVVPSGDAIVLAATIDGLDRDRASVRAASRSLLNRVDEFTWGRHVHEVESILQLARIRRSPPGPPFFPARRALALAVRRP